MAYTLGFAGPIDRSDHFWRHWLDFAAETDAEYEALADAFLGGPLDLATMLECHRRNGDRLRYNASTDEFGILRKDGIIKTYYKPNPVIHRKPTTTSISSANARNERVLHVSCLRIRPHVAAA